MPQPATQNFIAGLDPTSLVAITPSQLLQMVQAANPYTDKGLLVFTSDVGGIPTVPDGLGTPLWQRYMWIRIMAGGIVVYVWNTNGVSDATYQRWVSITVAGIADGSIITSKLADLSVTNGKIVSVDWTKLTGIPALVLTGSAAGGDLTGLYPNPTIAPNAVDKTKLKSDAAVDANRAVGTDHIQDSAVKTAKINALAVTIDKINFGLALQQLRTNGAGNAVEWFTPATPVGFISAEVAFPVINTIINFAHGLGAKPKLVRAVAVCKIADLNYATANGGDEVDVTNFQDSATSTKDVDIVADNVNVSLIIAGAGNVGLRNKTTFALANITKANWNLKVYALV